MSSGGPFFGKQPHALGKGRSFYIGSFEEIIGNEALKGHHVIYEDLELNPYVIVIDIDLGGIGRAFRTG